MPILVSILITVSAVAILVIQMYRPDADRPWRRTAAVVCVLLAGMFLFGLYILHPRTHPAIVIPFITSMLLLVAFLFLLALRDMVHTRKLLKDLRKRRAESEWSELPIMHSEEGDVS
ncbi:MAG: hypothetical protein ACPGXK_02795 [Phycisphaerae bacterium]